MFLLECKYPARWTSNRIKWKCYSASVVPWLAAPLRHGAGLQLGREEEEQRQPPQISRQVLISIAAFSLIEKKPPILRSCLCSNQTNTVSELSCPLFFLYFLNCFFQVKTNKQKHRGHFFCILFKDLSTGMYALCSSSVHMQPFLPLPPPLSHCLYLFECRVK